MKRLIHILLATVFSLSATAQISYVYRNDSTAHRLNPEEKFAHHATPKSYVVIAGENVIPVDRIDSVMAFNVDVPLITIDLLDYPDATELWDKELYLNARVEINGNGLISDLEPTEAQIRGRGNTTWQMHKKPYRIKFKKKMQIGNLNKGKNLVLLANYLDPTLLKNSLSFEIARALGVPYVNHYIPCLLRLNGHDKGAYLMTEKVGINSASVDIDEKKGILFELSAEFDEPYQFKSGEYQLPVMVKDPDFDELYEDDPSITPEQRLEMWKADFLIAENDVENYRPEKSFDIESFINYVLVFDITRNQEIGHPKSVYIHKTDISPDSLFHFGPIWDFDYSFNNYDLIDGKDVPVSPESPLWLHAFFRDILNSPGVKAKYRERMIYFVKEVYPGILNWIDNYARLVRPSAKLNGSQWKRDDSTYTLVYSSFNHELHVSRLKDWLERRIAYLCSTNNITEEDLK